MTDDTQTPSPAAITRREAVWRVGAMLGGVALVGGTSLLTACERGDRPAAAADGSYKAVGRFSADQVAMLDEIADTILPTTAKSPGAKAAATGPFMALMVTDTYRAPEQQVFLDGLGKVDEATRKAHNTTFMQATPQQRLAVLTALDQEAKAYMDARGRAQEAAARRGQRVEQGPQAPPEGTTVIANKDAASDSADKNLPDQRQENAGTGDIASGQVAADAPAHYFRMMKELTMLGFFTSEIGCTKAQRYVESPGRYEPCAPYTQGQPAWAPHA
ncbi:gluconate 2-dehydrogenase subunit 3 family protein [Roseisolibacter sp. H3M3-2]|uniref:gluconate 2-dehydrogenase subunit 3 family protein n=1 Tax=Roseisolibacter sp. H3M3-2 TaxID=3031323 RepID=UPI0023DC859E|nr:gluconate 2-dehydrogenase subunit 3 family protein [Roseisolibacter sp. H3M3-2]MDF1502736.1 gluconate 2-dehydrogenase subunit 3 family protein [Roseisolibacter sp. H3M3-2]